jgi:chromosome segregation ATPase
MQAESEQQTRLANVAAERMRTAEYREELLKQDVERWKAQCMTVTSAHEHRVELYAELHAENERLGNRLRIVEGERDECSEGAMELRAENERLKAAVDMVAEEREAWKKEAIFLRVGLRETVKAGEAWKSEVERLRVVLFKIADDSAHADEYVRWAQEVLD